MKQFNMWSTAEQVSDGAELKGKNIIITGASSGIGQETARVLTLRGANVIMACRNIEKANAAKTEIMASLGGQIKQKNLTIMKLDMNSLEGVRKFATKFNSFNMPLHQLINNAGVMLPERERTDDGFESQFGVNYLAHFLLTNLLLPPLKKAKGARVINVSSIAMKMSSLNSKLHDLNWKERKLNKMKAYGDSKLMNLMFSNQLNKLYSSDKIFSNALHPGVISTGLSRDQGKVFQFMISLSKPFLKTIPQGAATTVRVATGYEFGFIGGLYLSHSNVISAHRRFANNVDACVRLWEISKKLTELP